MKIEKIHHEPKRKKTDGPCRTAAYCRVSIQLEDQEGSFETQQNYYRHLIETEVFEQIATQNPDWTLVKVYADEGLTGTSVKNRVQFQQMIKDALEGKIDYIIAKSISRFARNTVDTLEYTRLLKEKGIGVYFEEQSLDTLIVTSEIFLTIHAAFAQEESTVFPRIRNEATETAMHLVFRNGRQHSAIAVRKTVSG